MRKCSNCYYSEFCDGRIPCSDYYPVINYDDDDDIDALIECNRLEFYTEWRRYIDGFES